MKKTLLALIGLMLTVGCASRGMNVEYVGARETPLSALPVYLKVTDARADTMIVSSAVMRRDLFTDVGDRLNLVARAFNGKTTQLSGARVDKAFYEALRLRLEALGVGILPESSPDHPALIIEIQKVLLDIKERRFQAEVIFTAKFYDKEKKVLQRKIETKSEEAYVIGKKGGEKALSGAFTNALNELSLEPLKKK